MNERRIIVFKDPKSETKGFNILYTVRMPFAYRDGGRYVVTKKQREILQAQKVEFSIKQGRV